MIGENKMRFTVAGIWIICFASMWLIFNSALPDYEFNNYLNQIEKSVVNKDWDKAKKSMKELKNVYKDKRAVIQVNNATEILTSFDLTLGQLEASVENEQEAAVEYIGALRATMDFVMKPFSGP